MIVENRMTLYKHITDLIHELGTPAHMKGHDYVRSAILDAYYDRELLNHMMKGLYTKVASEYNTKPSRVERDIRAVIDATWLRGSPSTLYSIFRNTVCSERGKPSNREFITMIVDYLKINI